MAVALREIDRNGLELLSRTRKFLVTCDQTKVFTRAVEFVDLEVIIIVV